MKKTVIEITGTKQEIDSLMHDYAFNRPYMPSWNFLANVTWRKRF